MIIDLRSDTVTKPTEDMRKAMYKAEVGDDVYGDDVTVNELEALAAEKLGKQSALFVPTGTMGNLLALLSHTNPGDEIILGENSHIHIFEVSGYSRIAGLGVKLIDDSNGYMDTNKIAGNINSTYNIHYRPTSLICIENSHNVSGGIVSSLDYMKNIRDIANEKNIPVHLDGARIFNAAMYLGCDVKDITNHTDSVMICLSKGLGAPVGSILAGTKDFIDKARQNRKMLGGGMRQSGVLAAAGMVALKDMPKKLKTDHENAYKLACGLQNIDGIDVDIKNVHTNIVMAVCSDAYKLASDMENQGILTSPFTKNKLLFTTNYHITSRDIDIVLDNLLK